MLDNKKLKSTWCLMAINHTLKGQLVSVLSCKVFGEWGVGDSIFSRIITALPEFFSTQKFGVASAKEMGVPILLCIICLNNAE